MNVFELTRRMIDIESVTPNEYEMGLFLESHLGALAARFGGKVERMPVEWAEAMARQRGCSSPDTHA